MSKETKILNLKKQIEQNRQKINKLLLINKMNEEQILKLSRPSVQPSVPTVEERASQSARDKENFIEKLRIMSEQLK